MTIKNVTYSDGRQVWYQNENIHREDQPAVIYPNGKVEWWSNNKLHRENAPAIIFTNGDEYWFKNGKCHREDGPAVEWWDGSKEWILNGVRFSEQEFLLKTAKEIVLTMDEIADKFGIEVSKLKISK